MPIIPRTSDIRPNSWEIMNALREEASANYRAVVPVATPDNVREIGSVLIGTPAIANEWYNALLNRIALTIITSKAWKNPWSFMRRGDLEFGETVEEIYIGLIDGYTRNVDNAQRLVFKRRKAEVRSVFHIQNFASYYPLTVERDEIRKAFLSWDGVEEFNNRKIEQIYTSWEYDEFNIIKYMIGRSIVDGEMSFVNQITIDASHAKAAVSAIKAVSNNLLFLSDKYNAARVPAHTPKDDQFLIISADADAILDVEVLADAFNMSKVEFAGHRMMVDSFADVDEARLTVLMSDEETGTSSFVPFTSTEKTLLANVSAILIDREWSQIYSNLREFTEAYNGQGMYWNYFFHAWQTFSYSPFANAIAFVSSNAASLTSITGTITAKTETDAYVILTIKPTVTLSALGEKEVKFIQTSAMDSAGITMTEYGVMTIPATDSNGAVVNIDFNGTIYETQATVESVTSAAAVTKNAAVGDQLTFGVPAT